MSDRIFTVLLASLLRFIASDRARWLECRRQLRKALLSEDPEQSRQGILAVAKQLENCYNEKDAPVTAQAVSVN